jgi:uncharacterized protein YbgA (DUF1722 family)/uncharacterized protein YbbK (DUF523 family)
MPQTQAATSEIRIGISSCLLGEKVRFDAGHKWDRWVTGTLAEFMTLVPVCPEVEVGMGIPRETVRLVGDEDAPFMIAPKSGADWTDRMNTYAARRTRELAAEDLCGYIFKKDSPSCGAFRVKVYNEHKMPSKSGQGLFAATFMKENPLVPVEEEGRLHDAGLRENFVERVFAYRRLKDVFAGRWKRGDVVAFHSREKYLLMAHSPKHYKLLGPLVAAIADHTPAAFRDRYMELFMEALAVKATTRRHVNTLQHMAGHLKKLLGDEERRRLLAVIEDYGVGLVPLIVPMTLLRHYIDLHRAPWVEEQTYLHPHPKELMLRNHV